jgi:hypothetical protein
MNPLTDTLGGQKLPGDLCILFQEPFNIAAADEYPYDTDFPFRDLPELDPSIKIPIARNSDQM